jgi:hypothetical protein
MKHTINHDDKTIAISDSEGNVNEIKSLLEVFKGYTLITGVVKEKKECVCNPSKGGDGNCICEVK